MDRPVAGPKSAGPDGAAVNVVGGDWLQLEMITAVAAQRGSSRITRNGFFMDVSSSLNCSDYELLLAPGKAQNRTKETKPQQPLSVRNLGPWKLGETNAGLHDPAAVSPR